MSRPRRKPIAKSRKEGKQIGAYLYESASPCRAFGHVGLRLVADGRCWECDKMRARQWREDNPAKYRASQRRAAQRKRDKRKAERVTSNAG